MSKGPVTKREAIRRLRRLLRRIVDESGEMIAAGEWWARNRPEERPLDIELARLDRADAAEALAALDRGDAQALNRGVARLLNRGTPWEI